MTTQTFTTTTAPRRRRMVALAASAALPLAGLMALATPAGASPAKADPKGNNGTVKIDRAPFDSRPDNQPHVGCRFEVDFYGFDKGDNYAQVTFNVHPPTGNGAQLVTDKVFIGEDDHSGGGSVAGLDAHREYDLTKALAAYPRQPQQGWHVKLTVHADGSQGADTKHKVFWVDGCEPTFKPPTPSTHDDAKPNTPDAPKPGAPETPRKPDTEVKPYGKDLLPAAKPTTETEPKTEVKGVAVSRPDGSLPRTGVETLPLAGLGLALLGTGRAARVATRRRRVR